MRVDHPGIPARVDPCIGIFKDDFCFVHFLVLAFGAGFPDDLGDSAVFLLYFKHIVGGNLIIPENAFCMRQYPVAVIKRGIGAVEPHPISVLAVEPVGVKPVVDGFPEQSVLPGDDNLIKFLRVVKRRGGRGGITDM